MSICYIFILGGGFLKIRFSQKPKTYNVLFIEKIYFVGNYSWIESDSDYETEETITLYATDLDIEDYQSLFH